MHLSRRLRSPRRTRTPADPARAHSAAQFDLHRPGRLTAFQATATAPTAPYSPFSTLPIFDPGNKDGPLAVAISDDYTSGWSEIGASNCLCIWDQPNAIRFAWMEDRDRKSTRLNSSHLGIS